MLSPLQKDKNLASCTEHIQTLWGQRARARRDAFGRHWAAAADCGSLCSLGGGRPTARHSVVIWKNPYARGCSFNFHLLFIFSTCFTTDSQLLLWVQPQSTVSPSADRRGWAGERSRLFIEEGANLRVDLHIHKISEDSVAQSWSIHGHLSQISANYRQLYYFVIVRWGK